MKKYECVFIFDPGESQSEIKNTINAVSEIIKKQGGVVENIEEWGRRKMAHPIKKKLEGYYALYNLSLEPKSVKTINGQLLLNDQILRWMFVRQDEKALNQTKEKQPTESKSEQAS